MRSATGVQAHATLRNDQAEFLIDFILQKLVTRLRDSGLITSLLATPVRQQAFVRDDCSDVFDHYLEMEIAQPLGGLTGRIQLWGQTTCYKGNRTNAPEPNKTYEIRETLIESLGLRRWLREEGTAFRTVHFTIGPANYAYGWFEAAKENAFDLCRGWLAHPPALDQGSRRSQVRVM